MAQKRPSPTLVLTAIVLDVLVLLVLLFMPRSGMEALAWAYALFPLALLRLLVAIASLVIAVRRRRWLLATYTVVAMAVLAGFWHLAATVKPSYEPLHEALRQEARVQAQRFGDDLDRRAYDARRARQRQADPAHGELCDLLSEKRDLVALDTALRQDAVSGHVNRPCTTYHDDLVSPLLHAVIHTYGPWTGGDSRHPVADETFLAPAAERLLAAGADPDRQDGYGNTALHYALIFRNEPLLDALLAGGACVLIRNDADESPLRTHSHHRLRRKIEAAADDPAMLGRCPGVRPSGEDRGAETRTDDPDRALLDALRSGRLEQAMDALQQGADPDAGDREGSAFEAALRNCRDNARALAQLLIDAGADIGLANGRGETPLHIALKYCRKAVPHLLEQGADPSLADRSGNTVLHELGRIPADGLTDTLNGFLIAGADVNQPNGAGQTPLMRAVFASASRERLITALLDKGADPDLTNRSGNTAMHLLAVRKRDDQAPRLLSMLAARGASLEIRNGKGQTPLIAAVERGSPAAVKALIEAGADVTARRARGATLIGALLSCDPEKLAKLELLLDAGADPAARREHGPLPLAQALFGKAYLDCLDPARMILASGVDPNLRDRNGAAAVHSLAVWHDRDPEAALELLVRSGADIDLENQQGMTALLLAARYGTSLRTIQRFLAHGADPNARDGDGNTLLHAAAMNAKPGHAERYRWLLEHGGDPQAVNDAGQTPLERARATRNGPIVLESR